MASSKSDMPLSIKTVGRDRPYFDLYQYCLRFTMDELTCVREMEHHRIDQMINFRNSWRQRSPNFGGSWHARRGLITAEQRSDCHSMLDWLQSQKDYKIVVSGDWGYFYTNDIGAIRSLEKLPYVKPMSIIQYIQDRPRDTLRRLNSQHEYRTYFRSQRIETQQRDSLVDFLANQENLRLSPGLKEFVENDKQHYYINENFFVDHDGMGIITMLSLVIPQIARKTVKLIRDK